MKRKFLIILLAIVCAVNCVTMLSACGDKENVDDAGNNSSVTDQTGDSNDDGSGDNSKTPETPENPESGDENNDKPTTPNTPEDDGKGVTGSTDSDTGETGEPDTPDTGNTPNTGDAEEKQDEYIYTKKDGWNIQLLAKTLEDWMIENNYYERLVNNNNAHLKKILFFDNLKDDNVTFTVLTDSNGTNIHSLKLRDSLLKTITSQVKFNSNQLVEELNKTIETPTSRREILGNQMGIKLEYSSLDKDYEIHKEEFETLTNNVISRLSEIGVQDEAGAVGEINDIFENSQIIYGFKAKAGTIGAGAHLGNEKNWHQIYLVEKNNKYQYIDVEIDSSVDGAKNEKQYVLENADDTKWIVSKLTSKEVLFVDNSK